MTSIFFLIQTIQRNQLKRKYLKKKSFLRLFSPRLKFSLNFKHFQKKCDPRSWCISEITNSDKRDYINFEKVPF